MKLLVIFISIIITLAASSSYVFSSSLGSNKSSALFPAFNLFSFQSGSQITNQPPKHKIAPVLGPEELMTQESRHKNRRQSYNHKSKPKRRQYQTHNRHSDGKKGKGGYYKTDSFKGNQGYSDSSTYNRANKNSFGDADHKNYGNKDGGSHGGGKSGGGKYGGSRGHSSDSHGASGDRFGGGYRGKYASDYSDNGNSYLNADGGGGGGY